MRLKASPNATGFKIETICCDWFYTQAMPVRKIPRNYRFSTGIVPLSSSEYAEFEGGLERDHLVLVRADERVKTIDAQPRQIHYHGEGKSRIYTPDLFVEFHQEFNLKPQLIEVKPRAVLRDKISEYIPKFRAASAFCAARGWKFLVRHEGHIRTGHLEVVEQLAPFVGRTIDDFKCQQLINTLRRQGPTTFLALQEQICPSPAARAEWLPVIWGAIAQKKVKADLVRPIVYSTVLEALR